MSDYIKREDAIDYLTTNMNWFDADGIETSEEEKRADITELVNGVPSADVAPVRHGRWIDKGDGAECSVCGSFWAYAGAWDINGIARVFRYCETCGTRMDGESNE